MSAVTNSSYEHTLDTLLRNTAPEADLSRLFAGVSDDFWLWCFTDGYRRDVRLRQLLPRFPPDEIQLRFTGAAGDHTMREAFAFYALIGKVLKQYGRRPLQSVLDFGCGWGRITRLFLRDVAGHGLRGIDCMAAAISICQETNAHAQFDLIQPFPPTDLPSDGLDLIYAYSVFSHLSESAHLQWVEEFARLLKRDGLLIVTTRPREFILTCAEARKLVDRPSWAAGTAASFQDTDQALARYDRGEFLFEPTGGGDVLDASFFGETCIPRKYVIEHWPAVFEPVDYIDDRSACLQNVIVARKR